MENLTDHTVDYEGFISLDSEVFRDQICTA
jgi:hypothetical protein